MLHEIFKGMDNASELINENFKNGSIVESGKDENGHQWKRFGDGTQEIRKTISDTISVVVANNGLTAHEITFPVPFAEGAEVSIVVNGYLTLSGTSVGGNVVVRDNTATKMTLLCTMRGTGQAADELRSFSYIAIGRWK